MGLEITILLYVRRDARTKNSTRTQWECCANSANHLLTSNGTTFKARWTLRIKEEAEFKEAKEAELKQEEEAEVKEAKNKVAAERIKKGKERVFGQVGGRTTILVGRKNQLVTRSPTIKRPRLAHMDQDAFSCATMVIAPNGMSAGKSRRLNRNVEMPKRIRWRAMLGIGDKTREPTLRVAKRATRRAQKAKTAEAERTARVETRGGRRMKRSLPKSRPRLLLIKPRLNLRQRRKGRS